MSLQRHRAVRTGVDFIQEVQVRSVGASAEFGNMQGAVINVITRQGSDRFLYDASYYGQPSRPTSQPLVITLAPPTTGQSGYERAVYRDFTTNFSGKPWGATTQVELKQGDQRIALEPRGTRRLESQTLLDLRLSRAFRFGAAARIELLVDVLNALNETAGEELVSDNLFSPTFGGPTLFVDPRPVMLGARLNLGR